MSTPIGRSFLALFVAVNLTGCVGPVTRLPERAAYRICLEERSGVLVHRLQMGIGGERELSVKVFPSAGANAFSFTVNGVELLRQPSSLDDLSGYRYGIPLLYPTHLLVEGGTFTFEGREYRFPTDARGHHTNGLVYEVPWEVGELEVEEKAIRLPLSLTVTRSHPLYKVFPFEHEIRVTHALSLEGLRIAVEIKNRGARRLPLGFGIRPCFRILGDRSETYVTVPARKRMEADRSSGRPSGELEDLSGSDQDLRGPSSLEKLDLDDVYWGMMPEQSAAWEARDRGIRVTLEASEVFTHVAAYTPQGEDYFCLANQTCSADAHNLYARGHAEAAHLLILEPMGAPGSKVKGSIFIRVDLADTAPGSTGEKEDIRASTLGEGR